MPEIIDPNVPTPIVSEPPKRLSIMALAKAETVKPASYHVKACLDCGERKKVDSFGICVKCNLLLKAAKEKVRKK